ncbi:hypothetical protein BDZ91DRAFT_752458 [Kalaharituber pfeilii]|nr:hypothetical protein BDZ91DRAFT_752458 [Kalaharituber pfeilii]
MYCVHRLPKATTGINLPVNLHRGESVVSLFVYKNFPLLLVFFYFYFITYGYKNKRTKRIAGEKGKP